MKFSQQIFATFLVLAFMIKEGLSLECYDCNTFVDGDLCRNPGPQTKTVVCGANETMCRKVEQDVYYNKDDHNRIVRQCATSGETGDCLERTGTYRFKSWYCQCTKDLCNGSGRVAMSFSTTAMIIFATVFGLRKLL